eukprot:Pgem_evm2s883
MPNNSTGTLSNTTRTYCRYVEGQPAGFPHGMTCEMTCAAVEGNGNTNLTMNVSPPPAPYVAPGVGSAVFVRLEL